MRCVAICVVFALALATCEAFGTPTHTLLKDADLNPFGLEPLSAAFRPAGLDPLAVARRAVAEEPEMFLEMETQTTAKWEFPSAEYCGDAKSKEKRDEIKKKRWEAWGASKVTVDSVRAWGYSSIVQDKEKIKNIFCPTVDLTDPKNPKFSACCAWGVVSLTYQCTTVSDKDPQLPALKEALAKWTLAVDEVYKKLAAALAKGPIPVEQQHLYNEPLITNFVVQKCPEKMGMLALTPDKVCSSGAECKNAVDHFGKDGVCCGSSIREAPGLCRTKCGMTEHDNIDRCDSDADCTKGKACCMGTSASILRDKTDRRGFCQDSCSDSKHFGLCGLENKCEGFPGPKCCQSMTASMHSLPSRGCSASCNEFQVDITGKKNQVTLNDLTLQPKASERTVLPRARNMQRFAQLAARAVQHLDQVQSVMYYQSRSSLEDACKPMEKNGKFADYSLQIAAQPLAQHIADSVLLTMTPFLLLHLTSQKEFEANFVTPKWDQFNSDIVKTFQLAHPYEDVLDVKALTQTIKTFATSFSLHPFEQGQAKLKKDWFKDQTKMFADLIDASLKLCNAAIIKTGAVVAGEPDYLTMARWIRDTKLFRSMADQADSPLPKDAAEHYQRARMCYSVYNRVDFGSQWLMGDLNEQADEREQMDTILQTMVTMAGTALTPLTGGMSATAAGLINKGIAFLDQRAVSAMRTALAALTEILKETMHEMPDKMQKTCEADRANEYGAILSEHGIKLDELESVICGSTSPVPGAFQTQVKPVCKRLSELGETVKSLTASIAQAAEMQKKQSAVLQKAAEVVPPGGVAPWARVHTQSARNKNLKLQLEQAKGKDKAAALAAINSAMFARDGLEITNSMVLTMRQQLLGAQNERATLITSSMQRFMNPCSFTNALDSHFEAIKFIYNQTLSVIGCSTDDEEAKSWFMDEVVRVPPEGKQLMAYYAQMLEPSMMLKIGQKLAKVAEIATKVAEMNNSGELQKDISEGISTANEKISYVKGLVF